MTTDIQTIFALLRDRPIAYHPLLAKALGGVKEALFISQLLYWHGKGNDPEGWIYKTREEITEETGLSRYEQEGARASLIKVGCMEVSLRGCPAVNHYRIVTERLVEIIAMQTGTKLGEKPPTSWGKNPQQVGGKTPNSCHTESTTESTTPPPISPPRGDGVDPTTSEASTVLAYLNACTGKKFRLVKGNLKYINGRLRDGTTVDDLKLVIAHKTEQWGGDPKMREYLRPMTLFGPEKFDGYLQAAREWDAAGRPNVGSRPRNGEALVPHAKIVEEGW